MVYTLWHDALRRHTESLRQWQVAEIFGISQQNVSRLMRGATPKERVMAVALAKFGMPFNLLATPAKAPPPARKVRSDKGSRKRAAKSRRAQRRAA